MRNFIYVLLLCCTTLLSSQNSPKNLKNADLWKGYGVRNATGALQDYKVQQFLLFDKKDFVIYDINEKMSMTTGEVEIDFEINTFERNKGTDTEFTIQKDGKSFEVERVGEDELRIKNKDLYFLFKRMPLAKTKLQKKAIEQVLIGRSFQALDVAKQTPVDDLIRTYNNNETATYQKKESASNWSSAFKILEVGRFVFLKGITSAPLLVIGIEDDCIYCMEMDYRFEPKEVHLLNY